jgi:hypothetical protein
MRTIDLEKPIQFRDGTKARIVCTDVDNGTPDEVLLVLARIGGLGGERAIIYHKSGLHFGDVIYDDGYDMMLHNFDLVNVEEGD